MDKKDLEVLMNAKIPPAIFYGLHMEVGVAEYREKAEPYRIFIAEQAIKEMDPSFAGKPVYVGHVDEVNMEALQFEADGYVVESFFNKADGKHWAKFIVVSDKGHEAIRKGWRLSNAYVLKMTGNGGQWHGVDYLKEVLKGEYDHLAIVPDPRYDDSIILTPDEFKEYNAKKEAELMRLANSNNSTGDHMKLNFFKTQKVENSLDLSSMSVELPKSKKQVELITLINAADEKEMNSDKPVFANGDHRIKVGEEEMSVKELVEKYNSKCAKNEDDDADEALEAEKKKNEAEEEEKKKNEAAEADKKKKEDEEKATNAKNAEKKAEFEALKNAREAAELEKLKNSATLETGADMVARGKSRYGSN